MVARLPVILPAIIEWIIDMTPAQKKAVSRYRKRQERKGISRVEISVPDSDKELLKQTAANLRAGGKIAEQTRAALRSVLNPYEGMSLKELLESAPLEGLELERSKETARDIDL
jgi:hypothetical protein